MKTNKDKLPEINSDYFEEIAPKFSAIEKSNSFVTPDNYFDDLPNLIQAKISEEQNQSLLNKILQYFAIPKHAISFGFTIVVLFFTIFFITKEFSNRNLNSTHIAYFDKNISIEKYLQDKASINDSINYNMENNLNYIPKPESLEKIEENLSTIPQADILEYLLNESEYDTNNDLLTDI